MYHGKKGMTSISVRQLGKHVSACIRDIQLGGKPVVVLKEDEPAAYIIPLDVAAELGLYPAETDVAPAIPWRPKAPKRRR
jgi:antitoxin (DNA-binding transcriptional repressor) of toxin-antitoxin stability system